MSVTDENNTLEHCDMGSLKLRASTSIFESLFKPIPCPVCITESRLYLNIGINYFVIMSEFIENCQNLLCTVKLLFKLRYMGVTRLDCLQEFQAFVPRRML